MKKFDLTPPRCGWIKVYNPENGLVIKTNEDVLFDYIRVQIAENRLEGYYVIFNERRIPIYPDGRLSEWPEGLGDTFEKQLVRIFKAGRI